MALAPGTRFPLIFVVTALGEVGLLYLRNHHLENRRTNAILVYVFNCLIDIRGALNCVAYFFDHESLQQLKCSSLRGRWRQKSRSRRRARSVRFRAGEPLLVDACREPPPAGLDRHDLQDYDSFGGQGPADHGRPALRQGAPASTKGGTPAAADNGSENSSARGHGEGER